MARKKVKLQWMANEKNRRASLRKRRAGLMKKSGELSTLCGVDMAVVVYAEGEAQPTVYPPVPEEARSVAERFTSLPELTQRKNMMDQEGFLRERIAAMQEQLRKMERENRESETELHLHEAMAGHRPGLAGLTTEELVSLGFTVGTRLWDVNNRIDNLQRQASMAPAVDNNGGADGVRFQLLLEAAAAQTGGFGGDVNNGLADPGPSFSSPPV